MDEPRLLPHTPFLILDGPTGTELIRKGYQPSEHLWTAKASLDRPDLLLEVHQNYLRAGAQILTANTFRANSYSSKKAGLTVLETRKLVHSSVALATEAVEAFESEEALFVAGSIGPLEDCYRPELVPPLKVLEEVHRQTAQWLVEAGCDLVLIETMGTLREARAALDAAQKARAKSVLVSFIVDETGSHLLGGEPLVGAAQECVSHGAGAVLVNCVHSSVIEKALRALQAITAQGVVLGAYANASKMTIAGSKQIKWRPDGLTVEQQAAEYAQSALEWMRSYHSLILGGCCGMTPEHIRALSQILRGSASAPQGRGPK
ncbi:MAG: homocysteine S-methyltransferase family protein [Bdellovibrionota bacterium]